MSLVKSIRAGVSPQWLTKADRLFRNDDAGVWAELLQNARRANATAVDVTIEETAKPNPSCLVTITDNGRGISDFGTLLSLGRSDWDAETQAAEDPAGMGFFALCRSYVEVHSGSQFIRLTPESFQGWDEVDVQVSDVFRRGTRISFTRESTKSALTQALKRVTEFCPLEVRVEGETLERHDFLEGALHRELLNGIMVGLATKFKWNSSGDNYPNWNFYGVLIHDRAESFAGYIPEPESGASQDLVLRFNVLETSKVKLQLPDRRAIIEDPALQEFMKQVRRVVYEFFQRQKQHLLPFGLWQEAKELGVLLPEAAIRLKPWNAKPEDEFIEPVFEDSAAQLLDSTEDATVVGEEFPHPHTLDAALHSGATVKGQLYCEERIFKGYSWYDGLPRIMDAEIFVDEIPYQNWRPTHVVRPSKMEMEVTIQQARQENLGFRLPILIHVNSDAFSCDPEFIAVQSSPWDNDDLAGPFSVVDFLISATFSHCDDGDSDSWETQKEAFERDVRRLVNEYFRGPEASLRSILHECVDFEANRLAQELGVTEIRLKKRYPTRLSWIVELVRATAPVHLTETQFLLLMVARSPQARLGPVCMHTISVELAARARKELLAEGIQWDAPIEELRGLLSESDQSTAVSPEIRKPSYDDLLEVLERIVESGDSEGCTDDLAVVARKPLVDAESLLRAARRNPITNF